MMEFFTKVRTVAHYSRIMVVPMQGPLHNMIAYKYNSEIFVHIGFFIQNSRIGVNRKMETQKCT